MEYWKLLAILAVAREAGNPICIDSFTDMMRKTEFARVRVELVATKPLLPRVLIQGKSVVFWQQIVYENLPPVCFHHGRMGHTVDGCRFLDDSLKVNPGKFGLCPNNFVVEAGNEEVIK